MDPFGRPLYTQIGHPNMPPPPPPTHHAFAAVVPTTPDPRMQQLERLFPTNCAADAFDAFARTVFNWPDLFESTARLIVYRLRTTFDDTKLAALYTLDFMVKRRDGAGGRPFAFIFARMPLHDIVLQFYHDVMHRRAQYPHMQLADLASKMDNMYHKWWEFLQEFLENGGAPFIDAPVLRGIAAHCAHVRPRLQEIAVDFSRRIEATSRSRQLGAVPSAAMARPQAEPIVRVIPPGEQMQQVQRKIDMFCDKVSQLFASEVMPAADFRQHLVLFLKALNQEKSRQAEWKQWMGVILANAEQVMGEQHKNALRPLWERIADKHKEHVVLKLYDDAAGVRPCELCGCRLEPQKMQAHVQRHRQEEHETFSKTRPWFLKRDDFEAGVDLKPAKTEGKSASSGGQAGATSPVASTPKIALDRGVRVKELKCALCGGPFTDEHLENVNGQSFLVHTVRWAAQLDDDAASPRSPGDDSMQSADGGGAGTQFAHSHCAQNIAQ